MNFDNWKPRSHYFGLLMTPAKGGSNKQKLQDSKESLSKKLYEFNQLTDKAVKTREKLGLEITKLSEETIPYLESIKDIPNLSETAKSKLAEVWTSETEGVTKNIKSKFLSKGLDLEEDGLTDYSLFSGELYNKNTVRKSNEWIEGCCDSTDDKFVIDTKISWDIFSWRRSITIFI